MRTNQAALSAKRDLSFPEFRAWRRFARRLRETTGASYPYGPKVDQPAAAKLIDRCGGDLEGALERIDAAFIRCNKPATLTELVRSEDLREFAIGGAS